MTNPQIIAFQETCRATHVAWVKYFTQHPDQHKRALTGLVGTKRQHERLIKSYDASIRALRLLPSRSGRKVAETAHGRPDLPDRDARCSRSGSPMFCEHANEVPQVCPCTGPDCYCKTHTCKDRGQF